MIAVCARTRWERSPQARDQQFPQGEMRAVLARPWSEEELSAVVNTALAEHVERLGRLATLRQLLDRWEAQAGPVPPDVRADAAAAFDEADAGPSIAAG